MLPDYRVGSLLAYWDRLQPIFFYLFSAGFEVFILLLLVTLKPRFSFFKNVNQERSNLIFFGSISLLSILIIVLVAVTKIGLTPDSYAWTVAGAPITIEQLYWTFVLYILVVCGLRFSKININSKRLDLWAFCSFGWQPA